MEFEAMFVWFVTWRIEQLRMSGWINKRMFELKFCILDLAP